uniref:L1 transposable element RRM domain-containing protein n=1 Tax=Xenopus tropicalis TaxID=8364 RepID=A0A803JMB6_XENTR
MGKTHKLRAERDAHQEKKQPEPRPELAPLFQRKDSKRLRSKMALTHELPEGRAEQRRDSSEPESEAEGENDITAYLANLPSKSDIKEMLHEVTATLKEELQDIRRDLITLAGRAEDLEQKQSKLIKNQKSMHATILTHNNLLTELQRQLEDQENRGRRNNIRIRGLPEAVKKEDIIPVLLQLFNKILKNDPVVGIEIERAHRVQKSKVAPPNSPRDILCCLNSFALKEEIISKARELTNLTHEESNIQLFQDISYSTLIKRKSLKPLTDILREKGIQYRWGFPFSLMATKDGLQAMLRLPKDMDVFCRKLQLPQMEIPGWTSIDPCPTDWNFDNQGEWRQVYAPSRTPRTSKARDSRDSPIPP